jgi:hypothetical protein
MTMAQTASRNEFFKIIRSICRDGILAVRLGEARFTALTSSKSPSSMPWGGVGVGVKLLVVILCQ